MRQEPQSVNSDSPLINGGCRITVFSEKLIDAVRATAVGGTGKPKPAHQCNDLSIRRAP